MPNAMQASTWELGGKDTTIGSPAKPNHGVTSTDEVFGKDDTCAEFCAKLGHLDTMASMSRSVSRYDNAAAESFFASLKAEIGTKAWATREEARRTVFAHLTCYNRNRLHSTLMRQTQYEARICYRQTQRPRA